jgi:hypothetical protein
MRRPPTNLVLPTTWYRQKRASIPRQIKHQAVPDFGYTSTLPAILYARIDNPFMTKLLEQSLLVLYLFIFSCTSKEKCLEGINILPMYGGQTKCEDQRKDDNTFIFKCDAQFKSRQIAAKYYVGKG